MKDFLTTNLFILDEAAGTGTWVHGERTLVIGYVGLPDEFGRLYPVSLNGSLPCYMTEFSVIAEVAEFLHPIFG